MSGGRPGEPVPLALVVAMDRNRLMGAAGGLPWHIPSDLRQFRRLTMGHAIVMGRRTYESIGKPLGGRLNIVVTSRPLSAVESSDAPLRVATSLQQAWELGAAWQQDGQSAHEVMVIGGAQLYAAALDVATRIYLTRVEGEFQGDTWFPELPVETWRLVSERALPRGEKDDAPCTFTVLERRVS
ncbi:MAG: dihydrofolate reductase [Pseudomonadales bacterium]|nr:dihydrofolate reductase [Pseudomonadales bacterium]